jgi:hypothetical protein
MIRSAPILLLGSLFFVSLKAGDFPSLQEANPRPPNPYGDFVVIDVRPLWERLNLPPTVTQKLQEGFVIIDVNDADDEAFPTLNDIGWQPNHSIVIDKKDELCVQSDANADITDTAQEEDGWITISKHIRGSKQRHRYQREDHQSSVQTAQYMHDAHVIKDSIEEYENAKHDGARQYYLNHNYHGSYHKSHQYAARIAHILFKHSDRNPPRNHEKTTKILRKNHQELYKNDTPQRAITNTPLYNHSVPPTILHSTQTITTAPITCLIQPLALTCHIIARQLTR